MKTHTVSKQAVVVYKKNDVTNNEGKDFTKT